MPKPAPANAPLGLPDRLYRLTSGSQTPKTPDHSVPSWP